MTLKLLTLQQEMIRLIAANGGDTNIDLAISPKGSGEIVIGTGSATGAITTSGAYDLVLDH